MVIGGGWTSYITGRDHVYHRPVSVSADIDRPVIYEVFPPEIPRGNFARGLHTHEAAAMLSRGLGAAQVRAGL